MYGFPTINQESASFTGGAIGNTRFDNLDLYLWGGDVLRLTGPVLAWSITGIAGGLNGRMVMLINRTGTTVTLKNSDANSLAPNQFDFNGSDFSLLNNKSIVLYYDSGDQRWRRLNDA